jgi:hypothetical protein
MVRTVPVSTAGAEGCVRGERWIVFVPMQMLTLMQMERHISVKVACPCKHTVNTRLHAICVFNDFGFFIQLHTIDLT